MRTIGVGLIGTGYIAAQPPIRQRESDPKQTNQRISL